MNVFREVLLSKLKESQIVIYGIGYNGTYTYQYLKYCGVDIIGFADIKSQENGITSFHGYDCMPIEKYQYKEKITVIVTPYWSNYTLMLNIKKMGFKECIDWNEMQHIFELCGVNTSDELIISKLKTNERYKNIHKEKRCFILGNGPSIKSQDLTVLKNEYVFSVNTGFNIPQFEDINPQFHVFVDSVYFSKDIEDEEGGIFVNSIKELPV